MVAGAGLRSGDFAFTPHLSREGPMEKVTIEIDPTWAKIARSPLYFVVVALQGVSVSFAPLFLYWSGKGKFFPGSEWIVVPSCFAVIVLVPVFYFRLAGPVIKELRQR
jgi:hypothetical protein